MMAAPVALSDITLPRDLLELPRWLCWQAEHNEGKKPRKVPYYASGPRRTHAHGSPEDQRQLSPFAVAIESYRRQARTGIGIALCDDAIAAIDLDNCVVDGVVHEEVLAAIEGTYAELSPSGNGVRAFVDNTAGVITDAKFIDRVWPYGLETYVKQGYVTVTGNRLPGAPLEIGAPTVKLLEIIAQRRRPIEVEDDGWFADEGKVDIDTARIEELVMKLPVELDYHAWLELGLALYHQYDGGSEGLDIWEHYSARDRKGYKEGLCDRKWESFGKRERSGARITFRSVLKRLRDAGVPISAAVTQISPAAAERKKRGVKGFPAIQLGEFALNVQPPRWLVKSMMAESPIVAIYGEPQAGKSTVAFDLACAVAQGIEWFGRKTKQMPVVYLAAESEGFMVRRAQAYAQRTGVDLRGLPFTVIPAAPDVGAESDYQLLLSTIKGVLGDEGGFVVVDTLSKVRGAADENSSKEIGQVIGNLERLARELKCVVCFIHHTGKDKDRGMRGSSALLGNVDTVWRVEKDAQGSGRYVVLEKVKGGMTEGDRYAFILESEELGEDEDGDPVTEAVVAFQQVTKAGGSARLGVPGSAAVGAKDPTRLRGWKLEAHRELVESLVGDGVVDMRDVYQRICLRKEPGKLDGVDKADRASARTACIDLYHEGYDVWLGWAYDRTLNVAEPEGLL